MLFKIENNSLNERKGFHKSVIVLSNNIFELNVSLYIYIEISESLRSAHFDRTASFE